ncbi:MAG: CoA-binding protein [Saprospiraceae bacterium]
MKKTVVLGATPNPARYAYAAVRRLQDKGHEVVAVGNKKGEINGIEIHNDNPMEEGVDTITMYLNAMNQKPYYEYIFSLNPKRIIFNPGAENTELARMLQERGIEVEYNCTLVMLSLGDY